MKRRWLIRLILLATLAAFVVWLEPTRVVWGWLRGEAFYQRRSTSYWRVELSRWESVLWKADEKLVSFEESWVRHRSGIEAWIDAKLGVVAEFNLEAPTILQGDRDAEAVLQALSTDELEQVRIHARRGLAAMGKGEPLP